MSETVEVTGEVAVEVQTKRCSKCGLEKAVTEFSLKGPQHPGEYHSWCKRCRVEDQKTRYRKKAIVDGTLGKKRRSKTKNVVIDGQEVLVRPCARCGETKPLSEFYAKNKTTGYYSSYCRSCSAEVRPKRVQRENRGLLPLDELYKTIVTDANDVVVLKHCPRCGEYKPLSELAANQCWCKACTNQYTVERNKNPEINARKIETARQRRERVDPEDFRLRVREANLKRCFGITLVGYGEMFTSQQGRCAICGDAPAKLCVDHDHETHAIRGLLCADCNSALGYFRDNPELLLNAIRYLRQPTVGSRMERSAIEELMTVTVSRKGNPLAVYERNNKLRNNYGINISVYDAILHAQSGACAICGEPELPQKRLHVDHDHTTGEVRGLLCKRCNPGLGHFRDSERIMFEAIGYLRLYAAPLE